MCRSTDRSGVKRTLRNWTLSVMAMLSPPRHRTPGLQISSQLKYPLSSHSSQNYQIWQDDWIHTGKKHKYNNGLTVSDADTGAVFRRVLELGSGCGLLGSLICSICRPSSFTFSDCHDAVIDLLLDNIRINLQLIGELDTVSSAVSIHRHRHHHRLFDLYLVTWWHSVSIATGPPLTANTKVCQSKDLPYSATFSRHLLLHDSWTSAALAVVCDGGPESSLFYIAMSLFLLCE